MSHTRFGSFARWSATLLRTVREGVWIKRGAPEAAVVLRDLFGVLLGVMTGLLFGSHVAAALLAVGAFIVAFPTLVSSCRHPVVVTSAMSVAFGMCAMLGGLVGQNLAVFLVVLFLLGLAAGLAWIEGPVVGTAASLCLIGFLVPGDLVTGPVAGVQLGALLLAGGLFQVLTCVVPPVANRFAPQREVLAHVYRALAGHAEAFADGDLDHVMSVAPLLDAHRALGVLRGGGRRRAMELYGLLSQAEWFRTDLGSLAHDRSILAADRVSALRAAAHALRAVGDAVEHDRAWTPREPTLEALDTAAHLAEGVCKAAKLTRHEAAADDAVGILGSAPRIHGLMRAEIVMWSPIARHALRLAVLLVVAYLLGRWAGNWGGRGVLDHGFWVPLTAVLVLRPEFAMTFQRGWARCLGSVAGALLVSAFYALITPNFEATLLVMVVCAGLALLTIESGYALMSLWITAWVVLVLVVTGASEPAAAWGRALASLAGGALAMLVYLLWPTWHRDVYTRRLEHWMAAQRDELGLLFSAYASPGTLDPATLHQARTQRRAALLQLEAVTAQLSAEPVQHGRWSPQAAEEVTAHAYRIGEHTTAVEARLPDTPEPDEHQTADFAETLRIALTVPTPGTTPDDLDTASRRLTAAASTPAARARADAAARLATAVIELHRAITGDENSA